MSRCVVGVIMAILVRIGIAAAMLGVSTRTLRRWDAAGHVKSSKTAGGHRRFSLVDIRGLELARSKNGLEMVEVGAGAAMHCRHAKNILHGRIKATLGIAILPALVSVASNTIVIEGAEETIGKFIEKAPAALLRSLSTRMTKRSKQLRDGTGKLRDVGPLDGVCIKSLR